LRRREKVEALSERIERTVNDGNTGIIGDGTMREDTGTVIVDQRKGRTDGHVALIQGDSPFHGESESSIQSSIGGMVGKIHVKVQDFGSDRLWNYTKVVILILLNCIYYS
jgi:hypothetical protein